MSTQDMRAIHDAGASRRTAADIMRPDPRTCSPFSTVLETTVIFRVEDCEAVPVVDEGRPVGIVTDRDVALALPDYTDLRGPARLRHHEAGRGRGPTRRHARTGQTRGSATIRSAMSWSSMPTINWSASSTGPT